MSAETFEPPRTNVAAEAYRNGVYIPLDESELTEAPATAGFPDPGAGPPFHRCDGLPKPPRLRHLIGPSVIALGMGLGAGEFLLWPNLFASGGFSIWWLFVVGVLTQFVVISEIERWTIATGESIFAGMARLDRWGFWPWFFLFATLVSFFWPGWASQSAAFTAHVIEAMGGAELPWQPIALVMMLVIYFALAVSTIVYNALEKFEIILVALFFPLLVLVLVVAGVAWSDVTALAGGMASIGSVPPEYVSGEQFPTLLIAVAYAGSGGTLLLVQSLWIRDKGFGMGAFQGRIAGLRGRNEPVSKTGYAFNASDTGLVARFRNWTRLANRELFLTFVVLIILSVLVTSLIVSATIGTDNPGLAGDLFGTVLLQAQVLRGIGGAALAVAFLFGGALILFSTQVGIIDTVTRLSGDIFHHSYGRNTGFWTLKRTFLLFLTVLVVANCGIILGSWLGGEALSMLQPNFLVIIAGPFTIGSMYIFTLVIAYMNVRRLPQELSMPLWKRIGMVWAAVLWGWFTVETLSRVIMREMMNLPPATIETISVTPVRVAFYGIWVMSLGWLVWAVALLKKGKDFA